MPIPFDEFDPKEWPKHSTKPCSYCGASRLITRHGRAKMRNPRPFRKDGRDYWIIGYTEDIKECSCDASIKAVENLNLTMGKLTAWINSV